MKQIRDEKVSSEFVLRKSLFSASEGVMYPAVVGMKEFVNYMPSFVVVFESIVRSRDAYASNCIMHYESDAPRRIYGVVYL